LANVTKISNLHNHMMQYSTIIMICKQLTGAQKLIGSQLSLLH